MRTMGLIGGMSWESTVTYYRVINEETQRRLGGQHNAKSLLYTVDFEEISACQTEDRWEDAAQLLGGAARKLVQGGAQVLLLCTNTMHKVAAEIERAAAGAQFIHILDPTAAAIRRRGLSTVALLGTRFTMEQAFYRGRLDEQGVRTVIPQEAERKAVHRIIYEELCRGRIAEPSRQVLRAIVESLQREGAQGVVLGCTELGLLLGEGDVPLPVFDTARLHALAAVDAALAETP